MTTMPAASPGSDAQPMLGDREFATLARLVHGESGIVLAEAKKGLVVSRLTRRLRDLGLSDFAAYCHLLQSPDGHGEKSRLISALTTNVTKFFREEHHFHRLAATILPGLIDTARAGGRVRLWSAGCSTGEEAYSLAMEVLDLHPDAAACDIRILATDIDAQVLSVATNGLYPDTAVGGIPPKRRMRYFTQTDGQHAVTPSLREIVTFAPLNLVGEWPMRGPFDVIFCRNVVIYFDSATQDHLWQRFAAMMPAGGHLFIGHSERVGRRADRYFEPGGITQYRRKPGAIDAPSGAA
ncbi:MAG: chemotaxis signal relay system methyltransferase CheR [Rhodobacteraceae bacterium HLUCCA12]|nr:MAG: chemotaxis signal relay system methyltransferase CheR [Rhodobacteraceae bacterium HLUCCA12]